jgi:hypothetical protein
MKNYTVSIQEFNSNGYMVKEIVNCEILAVDAKSALAEIMDKWDIAPAPDQVEEVFTDTADEFDGMSGNYQYNVIEIE